MSEAKINKKSKQLRNKRNINFKHIVYTLIITIIIRWCAFIFLCDLCLFVYFFLWLFFRGLGWLCCCFCGCCFLLLYFCSCDLHKYAVIVCMYVCMYVYNRCMYVVFSDLYVCIYGLQVNLVVIIL